MRRRLHSYLAAGMFLIACEAAFGHGANPINVFLDHEGKLFLSSTFERGALFDFGGVIFGSSPGIGVLSPGNGLPDQSRLDVTVLSDLLYWDGNEVMPTDAKLTIEPPIQDGFGHRNESPISRYLVAENSEPQNGMTWGVYDARIPGWDSHGAFLLTPVTSNNGVYGVVAQIESPGAEPTDPFLIPFIFDPLGAFSDSEVSGGVDELAKSALNPPVLLQAGDANQDLAFDQSDIIRVLQSAKYLTGNLATWGDGDWNGAPGGHVASPPMGDGVFDQMDLIAALKAGLYQSGSYAVEALAPIAVPEPSSATLVALAIVGMYSRRNSQLLKRSSNVKGTS